MNKKTGVVLVILLALSLIANVFAYKPDVDTPSMGGFDGLKDASMIIAIGEDGQVRFVNPDKTKFKRIKVGNERPLNIAELLPGKVIKTLDNIVIFSGSPVCTWHDGWIICEDDQT